METKMFQIQFTDKEGNGYFKYFHSNEQNCRIEAARCANASLEETRAIRRHSIFNTFTAVRNPKVVEYSKEKKGPVRGGIKFKLRLTRMTLTLSDGGKERNEWYECD